MGAEVIFISVIIYGIDIDIDIDVGIRMWGWII